MKLSWWTGGCATKDVPRYFQLGALLICSLWFLGMSLGQTEADEYHGNGIHYAFSKLMGSPHRSAKYSQSLRSMPSSTSYAASRKKFVMSRDGGKRRLEVMPRQGGSGSGSNGGWGGWQPAHSSSGGGYDIYTIIAVAAFAALVGALLYELLGGTSRRALNAPSLSMPPISLGLDSDKLPEVMVKLGDWIANSKWFDDMENNSTRTIRNFSDKIGVKKWFEAFKKDPVEYQCIRKMACETLASSTLAERSLKTNLGSIFLNSFGNFIQDGDKLQELIKEVVGNPKKCDEIVTGGYCDEN